MAELSSVIRDFRESGDLDAVANLPRLRFLDDRARPLLGATVLPEVTKDNNRYIEEDFALVDMIADDTDRYSPVRFKASGAQLASFEVALGDSSIGRQMGAAEYDRLVSLLGSNASFEQLADVVIGFAASIARGLTYKAEKQRWDAIIAGSVVRRVGNTTETIVYPTATGQRTAIAGAWTSDAYDPFDDIMAVQEFAATMGYDGIARIITSRKVLHILVGNEKMAYRSGAYSEGPGGVAFRSSADQGKLGNYLSSNGLPQIETYDSRYSDTTGRFRFMDENSVVYIFDTGRANEEAMELSGADQSAFMPESAGTVGYVGVGKVGGYNTPGRVVNVLHPDDHPKRVLGEGLMTHLPVFTEPNGYAVHTSIH